MTSDDATLAALRAPAEAFEALRAERDAERSDKHELLGTVDRLEREKSALQAHVARLEAELARTAPVSGVDEIWLARRGASLTYSLPHSGSRAGRPLVALAGRGFATVLGPSAEAVLDQVRKRKPVVRRSK